ncbi:MAG: MBL fold metallo-hydrolase [Proteobacteria bacterium]|nr:MBL fold metallo-hydrolase [Pseudomonadota bacterium]
MAERVVEAMGGMERLKAVRSIRTNSHSINFGSMTSYAAGAPPIHLSDGEDTTIWEPMSRRFSIHLRLKALVPFPGEFNFKEAFDGTYATRSGPRDYRRQTDPALPGAYLGARLKRLSLEYPQWLFVKADSVTPAGVRSVNGKEMPVLDIRALNENWRVSIDPDTDLPHSVVVREIDGLRGSILVETRYSDWRAVDGVMMPFRVAQFTGGTLSRRETRTEISLNVDVAESDFRLADISDIEQPDPSDVTWGWGMTHWFLGRYAMGRSSEMRQITPVALRQIGERIFQVTGTSHHNLVIVGPHSLAVIEAPFYPARSKVVLAALRQRWPDKPVQYLVLTHHHTDHVGGMDEYVKAGAQLAVAAGNKAFFENILTGSGIRHKEILTVRERRLLPDFGRQIELLSVPNSHAFEMIVAYFPDQKLLFATDLYSPGRPKQPPNYPSELLQAIEYYGLDVERLIGGHGTGPDDFSRFMESAK